LQCAQLKCMVVTNVWRHYALPLRLALRLRYEPQCVVKDWTHWKRPVAARKLLRAGRTELRRALNAGLLRPYQRSQRTGPRPPQPHDMNTITLGTSLLVIMGAGRQRDRDYQRMVFSNTALEPRRGSGSGRTQVSVGQGGGSGGAQGGLTSGGKVGLQTT
jgi:hypothetical protein